MGFINTLSSALLAIPARSSWSLLLLLAGICAGCTALAQDAPPRLQEQTQLRTLTAVKLAPKLNKPWSIAFISENDWLITEHAGKLRRVIDGELLADSIGGLPDIKAVGQGGLLDIALHPAFSTNQLIYLSYIESEGRRHSTAVLRGRLSENQLTDVEVIFRASPKSRGGRHFGSRLVFDDEQYLYISLGDRGDSDKAQSLGSHTGSIIRLHDDGSVPKDNPFVNTKGALPEIYSYGHRNVQGMVFDQRSGILWAHEHGPQGGDELNRVEKGLNYGWPTITYGVHYGIGTKIGVGTELEGMQQPSIQWTPSIAPSGLAVISSERYPEWKGNLLVGALKFQLLERITLVNDSVTNQERLLAGKLGRIRDIRQGPDGYLYLLTDANPGGLYRIE